MMTPSRITPSLLKRAFDFVLATVLLVLISPLLFVVALWIKLSSPGPVFYRGLRAGLHGEPFRIFKFRTMVPDAERLGGAETADDDPRITAIGHFLRRFKLDELPQLLNVIKGEMSFVGPRPEVLDEVARYTPEEKQLLLVRPGITDWASIKFHHEGRILKGNGDPHETYHRVIRPEKVRLGLEYVHRNSMMVDLQIVARTIVAIFK
jgi:lipopolysaccharide/colanic/teichoic acid biosynthesis glycosyltransferase